MQLLYPRKKPFFGRKVFFVVAHLERFSGLFFYLNGINICLGGGQQHRQLKLSQLQRGKNYWKYVENGSKSFRGGTADLLRENKVVYQLPGTCSSTCHMKLLNMYTAKLPDEAKSKLLLHSIAETTR